MGATRGIAQAFEWNSASDLIWVNRLHDIWVGWTPVHRHVKHKIEYTTDGAYLQTSDGLLFQWGIRTMEPTYYRDYNFPISFDVICTFNCNCAQAGWGAPGMVAGMAINTSQYRLSQTSTAEGANMEVSWSAWGYKSYL